MKIQTLCLSFLLLFISTAQPAHHESQKDHAGEIIKEMAASANNFLNGLPEALQKKAHFVFDDDERVNWHYFPKVRGGLMFKEMDPTQRLLAHSLIQSALSSKGYWKANMVMVLEHILHLLEDNNPQRDVEAYYLAIFGDPSMDGTWGWRFEGHHLSLNFTLHEGELIACTPMFYGANPATVPSGPHEGMEVLKEEEEYGRRLVNMLNDQQRDKAIFAERAPREIFTAAEKRVDPMDPKGIAASELNDEQQTMLLTLIREYVHRLRPALAEQDMKRLLKEGIESIHFAWAGGLNPGKEGHYYAVQGPGFIFEYDNVQGGANHIHTVWRDFQGDFGYDVLAEHYQNSEHHQ